MQLNITQPTLVVDEQRCKANIAQMAAKANGLKLRPHFKTHQSRAIGQWFKEAGITAITVSSIEMAQYFAADGWKEITIAFPVNILRLDEINELAENIALNVLVDNPETVRRLAKDCSAQINCYIEIDCGGGRTGITHNQLALIDEVAETIREINHLKLLGCYTHAGHTYAARGVDEINRIATKSKMNFLTVKEYLHDASLEFCWGDTPSCSIWSNFDGFEAISPGNFVFYDLMQQQIGSCAFEQIALSMYCPVVSKKAQSTEICIHGGAIHFAKDYMDWHNHVCFGMMVSPENGQVMESVYLKAVSQEHGILKLPRNLYEQVHIGDVVEIYPVHACLTAQAMRQYSTKAGQHLDHMAGVGLIPVID